MAKQTLKVPPFPLLRWDDQFGTWSGKVILRSWMGFRPPHYPGLEGETRFPKSDGGAELTVRLAERSMPTPEQIRAFQYLLDHEEAIRDTVLRAILSEYRALIEDQQLVPQIDSIDQLRPLIGELSVDVTASAKDGVAFIAFTFGCAWDEEHGVRVMMHGDRLFEVSDGSQPVEWAAEEAANARVPTADEHARALLDLAETYFALGHKAKAKEFAQKAVEAAAAQSAELRQNIEQQASRLGNDH